MSVIASILADYINVIQEYHVVAVCLKHQLEIVKDVF